MNRQKNAWKIIENVITLDIDGGVFWKLPYDIFSMLSAKCKENDTAMSIITSPVAHSKWRLS